MRPFWKILLICSFVVCLLNDQVAVAQDEPAEDGDNTVGDNTDEDGVEDVAGGDDDAVEDEGENEANEGTKTCFQCNQTEECGMKQHQENGTVADCGTQHCWIWKYEENEVVTYGRDCGEACTDDTRELDCRTSNNRTECTKCCSDDYCNDGYLSDAAGGNKANEKLSFALVFLTLSGIYFG